MEKHFKPIIDSLKQIIENTVDSSKDSIMTEHSFREKTKNQDAKENDQIALYNLIQASTPVKLVLSQSYHSL